MKKRVLLAACFALLSWQGRGQDIHFSQFYETSILRNPSLVGIYTEDYKIVGQTRNQWTNVGRGFRTGQLSAEFRFPVGREKVDFISVGFLGYSDKAGAINFKTVGMYPSLNFSKSLEDDHNTYLSLGFTGGHVTRTIDVNRMTFDNQYQNGSFDPLNSSGESTLPDPKLTHWDIGTGISINSSPSDYMSFYAGLGAYHFTKPKRSFYQQKEDVYLHTRWSVNGGVSFFLNDTYSVLVHGNYTRQGPAQEIVAGGVLRWSRTSYSNPRAFAISGGAYYRLNDAIVPIVKIDYKGQAFAFSYDINTSSLRELTKMQGGFEVSLFYAGFFYSGPEDKRSCPRF